MNKKMMFWLAALLALASAVAVLTIATTSSPLYATNFWTDTNIYFTIGRSMVNGLMPYRDLFDHKGPLLYMIYAVGALVSQTSFFGVWLLEIVSLTATLLIAYHTVSLYGRSALNLLVIPVAAIVTATCTAFVQGGSAEEFNLPALALGVYAVLRRFREGKASEHPARLYAILGVAMGWVFLIKYTNCGLFFGLALAALLYEWRLRGFLAAVKCALWCVVGLAIICLPVAIYLAAQGVLNDMLEIYFYENIFLYGEPLTLAGHIDGALAYLGEQMPANPVAAALAVIGCVGLVAYPFVRRERGALFQALAVPLGAVLMLLFTYWGAGHQYYALVVAALSPLAFCPLAMLSERLAKSRGMTAVSCGLSVVALAAAVPLCLQFCVAAPLRAIKREEMTQSWFADIIHQEEDQSLLDLTYLDQGFYLAAGVLPTCRYFVNNNLNTQEKADALAEYIEQSRTKFIVMTNYSDDPGDHYMLIAMDEGLFDLNEVRQYKLFMRLEEGEGWASE